MMVNEAYFPLHDPPKIEKRKRRYHVSEYDKKNKKGIHYQDNYGL